MRTTIIRLLLIAVFYLLLIFVFKYTEALLMAFVLTYIIEPAIIQKT